MPTSATIGDPDPYHTFAIYAGIPFWQGGLTLLAAAPGIGKTSWLLRMVHEASQSIPACLGCYEHTPEEQRYRLRRQAEARSAGAHANAKEKSVEDELAKSAEAVLLYLSHSEDTIRAVEETLIVDYGFPQFGQALLAMDYLQRIPVLGLTGMITDRRRGAQAAVLLHEVARRHGWAVIAASATNGESFNQSPRLEDLLGDESIAFEPDRVLMIERLGILPCSCARLKVHTLKDRTGPIKSTTFQFWGERFYPALENECHDGHC
jgi:hypothetical protein